MAYKYAGRTGEEQDGFRRGVLANANRGGENVATGAVIGALLGAEAGYSGLPRELLAGLATHHQEQIHQEIDEFVRTVPFARAC